MAELHWHRAEAERQLGENAEAYHDYEIAEESLEEAADALQQPEGVSYRVLLKQLFKQHASLLITEGKHDEADALLRKSGQ